MHEPHWHPNASEWHCLVRGQAKVSLFAADKRMTAHARLDDVPSLAAEILAGKIRGRMVIDL